MTSKQLNSMIGQTVLCRDVRTTKEYYATVTDARQTFGGINIKVEDGRWFAPNHCELTLIVRGIPDMTMEDLNS